MLLLRKVVLLNGGAPPLHHGVADFWKTFTGNLCKNVCHGGAIGRNGGFLAFHRLPSTTLEEPSSSSVVTGKPFEGETLGRRNLFFFM